MIIDEEVSKKISEIFFQHEAVETNRMIFENKNFVHYTSASCAMSIIKNKEVWLRQPYFMNDFSEVEHGFQCLNSAYSHDNNFFKAIIDKFHINLSTEIEREFENILNASRNDLYLFCISEHEPSENRTGRLSMWRAYGKEAGVAIVLRRDSLFRHYPGLKTYFTPVEYKLNTDFLIKLQKVSQRINENEEFIKGLNREAFKILILTMFRFSILTTKHKGFSEEKEWRIIHTPGLEPSKLLVHAVENINGIPQEIYKLPLRNNFNEGIDRLELADLVEKIIIGPTKYPLPMYKAFVKLLEEAGVPDAGAKVWTSDIPLRN